MRCRPSYAFACLLALSAPSVARAGETETAAQLFSAGKLAFQRKEYAAAAKAFEEADHVLPRAGARYNAAIAWELANEPARAADLYAGATAELSGDEQREATRRLGILERDLGIVNVVGEAPLRFTLGHIEGATPPRMVHLTPSTYTLTFRSTDEKKQDLRVNVRRGEITRAVLQVAGETPKEPPVRIERKTLEGPMVPEGGSQNPSKTAGWILVGVGGALAAGYLTTGILALDAKADFEGSSFRDASLRERASTFRITANVLAGTALVAGVIGVVLLLQPNRGKTVSRAALEPVIRF